MQPLPPNGREDPPPDAKARPCQQDELRATAGPGHQFSDPTISMQQGTIIHATATYGAYGRPCNVPDELILSIVHRHRLALPPASLSLTPTSPLECDCDDHWLPDHTLPLLQRWYSSEGGEIVSLKEVARC
jgi:hypothetical protein